ncbi:hypothetical protein [Loigolactobacillus jiayinensis]|uniref:Peptidoglycan-binding protein n=1 Tax=Loigolactobacillus jiayinensis TaxID=2486016 RepID=A0ABW1RIP8_9LACO|nr:hypothetical protein [Loigolactobacillus jiayinensis]
MYGLGKKALVVVATVLMASPVAFLGKTQQVQAASADQVVLKQMTTAPHGEKSFAITTVALRGDKIVASHIDEFQFVKKGADGMTPVPNSDGDFAKGMKKKQMLISKDANDEGYSELMKEEGKATKTRSASMTAIEEYTVGKTVKELKTTLAKKEALQKKVISGATLTDTNSYVKSVVTTATKGFTTTGISVADDNITLKQIDGAPHGNKSFAVTTVAMSGDKIAAAAIDEFQFVAKKGFKGVPNSNKEFGDSYAKGQILISKQANDKAYSKLMKDEAKATQSRNKSINAITKYAAGKTATELKNDLNAHDKMTDVVSGATLEDTNGYIKTIVEAANE